ncbi:MAG: hypothetical protein H6594_12120 [Flavobacteriales bacterium]|nr:hypothetical protein [Flavobacteriales bacterium]
MVPFFFPVGPDLEAGASLFLLLALDAAPFFAAAFFFREVLPVAFDRTFLTAPARVFERDAVPVGVPFPFFFGVVRDPLVRAVDRVAPAFPLDERFRTALELSPFRAFGLALDAMSGKGREFSIGRNKKGPTEVRGPSYICRPFARAVIIRRGSSAGQSA